MSDLYHALENREVFRRFPPEVLKDLAAYAVRRNLDSGEFLCHQGEFWPAAVYVHSGQLRWSMVSSGGKEHQLFRIEPGEIFWAHSFFDDREMPASLSAVKEVTGYVWTRETLLPLLKRYPEAMWELTGLLTRIMREAREIIYGLAFQPVAGRLAAYLLDSLQDPDQQTMNREMTLDEMASSLATSPEVVCRLLYQFQSDQIIEITRTTITFQDRRALEELVERT
jgi:CRP/FNR family transcriptional regulator